MPHPYPDLSVTRHDALTAAQLWNIGEQVATAAAKRLYARADVRARTFERRDLIVRAAPTPANENHANVEGWPPEKPAQKIIAQQIAAEAGRAVLPPS